MTNKPALRDLLTGAVLAGIAYALFLLIPLELLRRSGRIGVQWAAVVLGTVAVLGGLTEALVSLYVTPEERTPWRVLFGALLRGALLAAIGAILSFTIWHIFGPSWVLLWGAAGTVAGGLRAGIQKR